MSRLYKPGWEKLVSKRKTSAFILTLITALVVPMAYNPVETHAGVDCSPDAVNLSGSSWLGGNGVDVCGADEGNVNVCVPVTGAPKSSYCDDNNVWSGTEWQCVELVNRLYLTQGWSSTTWYGNGNTLINNTPSGLITEKNGSISYVNPGDVVTLNNYNDPNGHAAIINSIDGDGTLHIINQNVALGSLYSSAKLATNTSFAAKNAKFNMVAWSGYTIQAIVHRPSDSMPGGGGGNSNGAGAALAVNQTNGVATGMAQGANHSLNAYGQRIDGSWVGPLATGGGASGIAYSRPAIDVNDTNGAATAAVEGPNNKFYAFGQRIDSSWVGPIAVGGGKAGIAYSDPALYINQSNGAATALAQGPNNSLYAYGQRNDGSWVGPNQVGSGKTGIVYSAPSIAIDPTNGLGEAVAEGPKNSLYYYWQNGDGSWSGPVGIAGGISNIAYSAPSMSISADGCATIIVQGPNNSMNAFGQRIDRSWVGPLVVNSGKTGYVYSAPSLALRTSNGLAEAIAEGPKNSLYFYWQNDDGSWSGPVGINGGNPNLDYSVPAMDMSQSDGVLTVLVEGANNSLNPFGQRSDFSWVGPLPINGGRTGYAY